MARDPAWQGDSADRRARTTMTADVPEGQTYHGKQFGATKGNCPLLSSVFVSNHPKPLPAPSRDLAAAVGGSRLIALAALLGGAAAIALAPICVRLSEVGPIASAFWRVALAAPALWLMAVLASRPGSSTGPLPPLTRVIAVGLSFAGDLAFWHWSIRLTTVANATLLANLSVVFVTLVAWLTGRERITGVFVLGMVLALAGAATMMGTSLSVSTRQIFGDALAVITAMFYAAYLLGTKSLRDARHPTLVIMAWGTLVTALVLLPVALASGESMLPQTAYGWGVLLVLAFISHAGGQTLIAYALAHLPATFSSVALLVQPVLAAFLAWVLFGERLGPLELAGSAAVLVGIALAGRGSRQDGDAH
jgi:drug/metabolite transporter (DMT)-like permease